MSARFAKDAMVEQLRADGTKYVFGNPGTTEQAFLEALQGDGSIKYIMALQEAVAVGMADGYARATRQPAFIQLHCSPGLGNGMGLLYNAYVGQSPLVVYVGQQDSELFNHQPLLAGSPAAMMSSVAKETFTIERSSDLPLLMRRAFKTAGDPPQGPVCISIPADVLDETVTGDVRPSADVDWRSAPADDAVESVVEKILSARNPMIFCGDGVALSGATGAVESLAEFMGSRIYTVLPSESTFSRSCPLFMGNVNVARPEAIRDLLQDVDLLIAIGAPLFPLLRRPLDVVPSSTTIVQIDCDSSRLGRTYTPEIALKCDPNQASVAIARLLAEAAPASWKAGAAERRDGAAKLSAQAHARFQERLDQPESGELISPFALVSELVQAMPSDTIVFEDAPTMSGLIQRSVEFDEPGQLLMAHGGGLGQGMPATLGIQLAHSDRPVVGVVGDGSAMYTIQALWTAARYRIPATFVICSNGGYRILETNMAIHLGSEDGRTFDEYFNLDDPTLDFRSIAESYGVDGVRVTEQSDLAPALREAIRSDCPIVVDVTISSPRSHKPAAQSGAKNAPVA